MFLDNLALYLQGPLYETDNKEELQVNKTFDLSREYHANTGETGRSSSSDVKIRGKEKKNSGL